MSRSLLLIGSLLISLTTFANDIEAPFLSREEANLGRACMPVEEPRHMNAPVVRSSRAFHFMNPEQVEYIIIRPTLMPYSYTPRAAQNFHQSARGFCDIGFHFGIYPSSQSGAVAFELRSLEVRGAFARGLNNNIGIMVHGLDIMDFMNGPAYEKVSAIIDHLIASGEYPNLKGIKTGFSYGDNQHWTYAIERMNADLFSEE